MGNKPVVRQVNKNLQVITPPVATDAVERGLVELTEALCESGRVEEGGFMLGGRYGYGENFENDVFMMHRYCWCDQEDCGWCAGNKPNFLYRPSAFSIAWYKWIGRDMEYSRQISSKEWRGILNHCLDSIVIEKSIE